MKALITSISLATVLLFVGAFAYFTSNASPFADGHSHSPAYHGLDVSYLEDNDAILRVCDGEPDGREAIARAYDRKTDEHVYARDTNGFSGGCGATMTYRNYDSHSTREQNGNFGSPSYHLE
jgi:hypothetical protein